MAVLQVDRGIIDDLFIDELKNIFQIIPVFGILGGGLKLVQHGENFGKSFDGIFQRDQIAGVADGKRNSPDQAFEIVNFL